MSESRRYLASLEALRELFIHYPVHAELSSIRLTATRTGAASIVVRLRETDPVVLAAGIVEWRRTLAGGNTWAWRTANGTDLHVATTGYAPECRDVPLTVVGGPIPSLCCLDVEIEHVAEIDDDTLYRWLGDEIANDWPFEPATLGDHRSPPVGTAHPHLGATS